MTSCDDIGRWRLMFPPPEDDQSAPEDIGYIVELVSGRVPGRPEIEPGDVIEGGAIEPDSGSTAEEAELSFRWTDGSTDDQEPFRFVAAVRAVDRAGNVGEPSEPIHVGHPGDGGCGIGRRGAPFAWMTLAVALAALIVRRARFVSERRG